MDIDKAVATWQKLLDTNPNYEGKDKVLELMAQTKKHSGVKTGDAGKAVALMEGITSGVRPDNAGKNPAGFSLERERRTACGPPGS
jgi:cytochrome c-type biogenesis protein CcmH/NrfG